MILQQHQKYPQLLIVSLQITDIILFFFIYSVRIRVGRSIDGFGLSPGITREQRLAQETLMSHAFAKLEGDLAGKYFPLLGMNEADRQQLVSQIFSL